MSTDRKSKEIKDKKAFFTEWLEKLQQESWQLELLISGFVIYGLFEFSDYLEKYLFTVSNLDGSISNICTSFIVLGIYSGVHLFIINLIFHVLVRAIWIGAIGLRYVSGEIDYSSLNYSDRFTEYFEKKIGSFDDYIEKLEKLSSIIFSYTFLLFFMFLSFVIFIAEMILLLALLANLFGNVDETSSGFSFDFESGFVGGMVAVFLVGVFILGAIVFIDFLFLGIFKKVKQRHFSWLYLKIYRLVSFVTLSFLWRPILLNFLDDKYTRKFMLLSMPYIFIVIGLLPENTILNDKHYPQLDGNFSNSYKSSIIFENSYANQFYDDARMNEEDLYDRKMSFISIPSRYVSTNVLEVFVKALKNDGLLLFEIDSTIFPLKKIGMINKLTTDINYKSEFEKLIEDSTEKMIDTERQKLKQNKTYDSKAFKKWKFKKKDEAAEKIGKHYGENLLSIKSGLESFIEFKIDGNYVDKNIINCDFYKHPNGKELGLLCFFPIDSLNYGRHHVSIERLIGTKKGEEADTLHQTIPFIYQK